MDKEFDCIKMKEQFQAIVYEKKDMTFLELRTCLNKSLENNLSWQKLIRRDKAQKQTNATC